MLIRKVHEAAVDIDNGGGSTYEMLALVASANSCVRNLETQLTILEASALNDPDIHQISNDRDSRNGGGIEFKKANNNG